MLRPFEKNIWAYLLIFICLPIIIGIFAITVDLIGSILIINTILAVTFLYLEYKKEKVILTLGNAFTIYWFFYTNSIWLNYLLGYHQHVNLDGAMTITILSMVGFVAFQLVYFTGKTEPIKTEKLKEKYYNHKLISYALTIIFFTALALEFLFFYEMGISRFIFASRPERVLLIESSTTPTFFNDLFFLVLILGFIMTKLKPTFWFKVLFFLSTVNIIGYQLIIIDRSGLLKVIFPLLFFFLVFKHIKNRTVIIWGTILFIFLSYFKVIMSNIIFREKTSLEPFRFNAEFESWYFVGMTVINDLKMGIMNHIYGKSYFEALYNLIFPFTNSEPLSIWYVRTYHYQTFLNGGGKAFSSIAEAIMNFGYIGVPIYFAVLGLWCRWLKNKKHMGVVYIALYAFTFTVMYKFFRAEFYSLTKTSWWYFILPMLLLLFVAKQRKKHKRTSTLQKTRKFEISKTGV